MQTLFPTTSGQKRKQAGKEFEAMVLASQNDGIGPVCVLTAVKSFARWLPADEDWKRRTGQNMRLMQEKSPYDFAGVVWQSGIGIFVDAKSYNADVASFGCNNPKLVKPHQLRELERLEAGGAFAGFLVRCGRMNDCRFCWASVACEFARKGKPMAWADERWDVLGPIEWGRPLGLRNLFARYK